MLVAIGALRRLSESDAVRVLAIHKCKGLEFEKVVKTQPFWGIRTAAMSEFFVAISRAKAEPVLSYVDFRERPIELVQVWDEDRTSYQKLIDFACDD